MKAFNFHEVKSVKEATKLASNKSTFLAGGMTLIPSMKMRLSSFSDVIDIKEIKELCLPKDQVVHPICIYKKYKRFESD